LTCLREVGALHKLLLLCGVSRIIHQGQEIAPPERGGAKTTKLACKPGFAFSTIVASVLYILCTIPEYPFLYYVIVLNMDISYVLRTFIPNKENGERDDKEQYKKVRNIS
jgi:hypothetical protein